MVAVVLVLLLLLVFAVLISVTMSLIGFLLMLFMAGLVGAVADAIVPGELPFGWLGAILAGLVGSWLGVLLVGHVGPRILGIPVFPALLGAIILAFVTDLVAKATARRTGAA